MLKLLLVDDEPIILEGLQKTINWNECGFEVIGAAVNGLDGLEKIKTLSPDVVITDVRMNFIDGLELIRKSKELSTDISFVVLSAYNEFEYAKAACDLGAFSYISKPFDEEQILETMSSLKEKILTKKASEEKLKYMTRLLSDQKAEMEQRLIREIFKQQPSVNEINSRVKYINTTISNNDFYVVVLVRINEVESSTWSNGVKDKEIIIYAVRKLMSELLENEFPSWNVYLDNENVGLLLKFDTMSEDMDIRLNELLDRGIKLIKRYLGVAVSISRGTCHTGYEGMTKSFNEAGKAMELSYIIGDSGIVDIRNTGISADITYKYPYKIEYNILNSIKVNDIKGFKHEIENFNDYIMREAKCHAQISFSLQCLFNSIVKIFMEISPIWLEKYSDMISFIAEMYKLPVEKILRDIIAFAEEFINCNISANYSAMNRFINDIIKMAVGFITDNISDSSLTIKKVSEQVHLNPVYFGRLFKKELGVSFIDYVTHLRIEMAKKLLLEGNFKVYQVAEEVGLYNLSYFNVLFKKCTGATPVEFKNEAGKRHE